MAGTGRPDGAVGGQYEAEKAAGRDSDGRAVVGRVQAESEAESLDPSRRDHTVRRAPASAPTPAVSCTETELPVTVVPNRPDGAVGEQEQRVAASAHRT